MNNYSCMLGFPPKLPVTDDDRQWVDDGFRRLERVLGRTRMLESSVVLPIPEHFPDPYDGTEGAVDKLFERICKNMRVDARSIDLEVFADETEELRNVLPYWKSSIGGCAGLYVRADGDARTVVAVKRSQLKDTVALVATLAHELGHVILLGDNLIDHEAPDMEPLTDLATVFLGFGVFTANCAVRFQQYQTERKQGWSMTRLGYLPEQVYGYALAKFAAERGEMRPEWTRHLTTNVRAYYKRARAWLEKHKSPQAIS